MSAPILQDAQAVKILYVPLGHTAPLPTLWRPADAPAAAPLQAFWVGDMDIYAAHSAADALVQCLGHSAMPVAYELDDVTPVTEAELAMTLIGEDGHPDGTLAELLATATAPGWLMGTES